MPLAATHMNQVEQFRAEFEKTLAGDSRFAGAHRNDRPDGATLATRWQAAENPHVWFEIAVRPSIPQVRVAILTDDRWKSEDLEEKIQESGDTMREFVEMGFHDAGLDWLEPPVEHYREDMKYFYFATAFEPKSLDDLADPALRKKVRQMFDGYHHAFKPYLKA